GEESQLAHACVAPPTPGCCRAWLARRNHRASRGPRSVVTNGVNRCAISQGHALFFSHNSSRPPDADIMVRMRIIGIAGWSGAGKTTLLAKLIPRLTARGGGGSTVQHAPPA